MLEHCRIPSTAPRISVSGHLLTGFQQGEKKDAHPRTLSISIPDFSTGFLRAF